MLKKIYFFIPVIFCYSVFAQVDIQEPIIAPRITIWIHGTQPMKLLPDIVFKFNKELISYFQNFMPGLVPLSEVPAHSYVKAISKVLFDSSSDLFPVEHFYQFGWSGDVSVDKRRVYGHQLYQEIKNLVIHYKKQYGCIPILTLISHSHGGNVALHMHELFVQDQSLIIDRLVLLGCPIQVETADYVESSLFRSIINVYSEDDVIQIIDPQWLQPFVASIDKKSFPKAWQQAMKKPWFSGRIIKNLPHRKNVCVSWCCGAPWQDCTPYLSNKHVALFKKMSDMADFFNSKRGLSHIEIQLPFFLKHLPDIFLLTDAHTKNHLKKTSLDNKVLICIS